jgi:polyhydroxyalkanoate synthesis regulator phasin
MPLLSQPRSNVVVQLLETNSTLVHSDILKRVQESRGQLEVEIRKLLHEVSRIAEQALVRARRVKDEEAPAVQAARSRLDALERELSVLARAAFLP